MGNINPQILIMLYRLPVLLISFMTHELAHALVAYRCGDTTAKDAGRISFNPLRHIDPFGALMLLIAGFGWAKPVPINPEKFKNKKAGIMLTSIAGPFSNIILATLFYIVYSVYYVKARPAPFMPFTSNALVAVAILYQFYAVNISLAAFNLIPIPPLDGSKVLFSLLPEEIYYKYILRYERYGMIVLMALSFSGYLMVVLGPVIDFILMFIETVTKPIIAYLL
ncbi:MAG: site-2 protease family protein [Oscillospiraceae bacterium]|nr:site-2 protease family protein [Oscillospiraceae bacterium]